MHEPAHIGVKRPLLATSVPNACNPPWLPFPARPALTCTPRRPAQVSNSPIGPKDARLHADFSSNVSAPPFPAAMSEPTADAPHEELKISLPKSPGRSIS